MNSSIHETDPRVVGQRIASARRSAGLTQAAAADALDMSRPTYIAIEKGVREAKAEEIVKLAKLLCCSVHDLVRAGEPLVTLEPHLRAALDPAERETMVLDESIHYLEQLATDYRDLERMLNAPLKADYPPEVQLPERGNIYDFAEDVAGRERDRLQLGTGPVHHLRNLLESKVGVRVFYGKLPKGFSGMYVYVPDLGYCILLNMLHPSTRRRFSLAHEYGHFLCDRRKPGVDRTDIFLRKPRNEQFCDAFAMGFLMPRTTLRQFFNDVVETAKDFQVADLVRFSHLYEVSLEAATRRLEQLGLIRRGTWEMLKERGFAPKKAREALGIVGGDARTPELLPERYRMLAVRAYYKELISEGQLARYLRTDRLKARETAKALTSQIIEDGSDSPDTQDVRLDYSLFKESA